MQHAPAALRQLRECLDDPAAVLCDPADLRRYEHGARYGAGRALCVLRPRTTEELRAVVRVCVQHRIHVVPQGANTGLVAASTPDATATQVILSMERMKRTLSIEAIDRTVKASAGVTLSELNIRAAQDGLHLPIDLGADPTVGGMVATNTGGARLLRYGGVRQNVLGLEVVLMDEDATRVDLNTALRKNNAGMDLKQLFIGSAGTLGIVTEATLRLWPLPAQRGTALVALANPADALLLYQRVDRNFSDFCTAFEGMSCNAMAAALRHVPSLSNPFPGGLPAYAVLLELSTCLARADQFDLEDRLVEFLGAQEDLAIKDAVIGRGEDLWAIRHALSEGLRHEGRVVALDISLPRSAMFRFREEARSWLESNFPQVVLCDFGHIGDGGMHFNMAWPQAAGVPTSAQLAQIRTALYDLIVRQHGGSFSAEHGIGPYNQAFYDRYTPPVQIELAGKLKEVLDPLGLTGMARFGPPGPQRAQPAPTD